MEMPPPPHELLPIPVVPITVNLGMGVNKMPEVLEGPVLTGVYTLPEEPENEENSEM